MEVITYISSFSIPAVLVFAGTLFLISKKNLFSDFLDGAKEGLTSLINLVPTLVILIVAISMFRASGGLEIFCSFLAPVFALIKIPEELIGFIIMRPLSGSGSTAMLTDLYNSYGADSFTGRAASLIMGTSDTVFYIFAVYFAAAGVKKTRFALPAAILTQVFCAGFACFLARIFWGG